MNALGSALHLDPAVVGGMYPLAAAPGKYAITGPDSYVHLPRSMAAGAGLAHVNFWCGTGSRPLNGRMTWSDEIPGGRSVCGTCEGRRGVYCGSWSCEELVIDNPMIGSVAA